LSWPREAVGRFRAPGVLCSRPRLRPVARSAFSSATPEDFFDDLGNGVDPATITHRHGVRFLD